MTVKQRKELLYNIDSLEESYDRWKTIYEEGCNDPSWGDGTNLTLVRSHIKFYKRKIEEQLEDNFLAYPDHFFYPLPIRVDYDFMVKDREFRGELHKKTKTIPYSEALPFKWYEAFEISL